MFSKKVLKTGVNLFGNLGMGLGGVPGGGGGPKVPKKINMINISPVLATFSKSKINMINMINISPVWSIFWSKCA